MPNRQYAFPWGIYIGDLIDNTGSEEFFLPVCVDSQTGGFCVIFDNDSQIIANNFIENIALKLFDSLPPEAICVDIFDFSHRKRFNYLSALQTEKLYDIALTSNNASSKFNELEKIAIHRHHNLLSFKTTSISQYNQQTSFIEKYHLLLINLDHYPDDVASFKRIKEFFDSAYDAGFYCIAFGSNEVLSSELKATQVILNHFPQIKVQNKKIKLTKEIFAPIDSVEDVDFEYINDNKDLIIEMLLDRLQKGEQSIEQDFLSIPIGTSTDGRNTIHFTLGDKSQNHHAFITGVAGSGKTTLLNNIIVGIAEKYTAQEVRLYLMDYKEGVEFQVFKNHPNCEKIFLDNEDLQASITLLEDFVNTIKQRSEIFKQQEVKNINEYNQQQPQQTMERLILVIDEVHRLFAGNYKQKEHFSSLLKQVVRQGRAFGVHIILSTQTLAGTQIDKELMSQITLRISYKLTDPRDAETIFTYGNTDALDLGQYELIYNKDSGKQTANTHCRANPPKDIKATIDQVLATRQTPITLQPKIIKTQQKPKQSKDKTPTAPKKQTSSKTQQYNTQNEKELLQRLIQTGKIKAPTGFKETPTTGKS